MAHPNFPSRLDVNGTVLLHHLNPREGFSRRNDAGLQCLASRSPANAASHRPCRRDATQCQSSVRSASIFPVACRIYGSDRIDDIEDNSQLRRGLPGTSSAIHPVMSRLILCCSSVKLPTRYMGFHRPLIPLIMCTSWPFKKSLLSKRRETGLMTVETDCTPRAIWIRS